MSESLKKFAKELKSFREAKDISLQYISNRTKIDIKFLQAIEEGDFDILPELYIRAFIKEYAKEADFDVAEILKKYDSAKKGINEEKVIQESELVNVNNSSSSTPIEKDNNSVLQNPTFSTSQSSSLIQRLFSKKFVNYFYYSSTAIIIVFIAVYFMFLKERPSITPEQVDEELNVKGDNRFELLPDSTQNMVVEDDSLNLGIKASEKVWIKVLSDNKNVYESFVNENGNLLFKAEKEFRVSVGNAGSISMELNKKKLQVPGNKGEIRSYIINSDTIKSYVISIPVRNENRAPKKN